MDSLSTKWVPQAEECMYICNKRKASQFFLEQLFHLYHHVPQLKNRPHPLPLRSAISSRSHLFKPSSSKACCIHWPGFLYLQDKSALFFTVFFFSLYQTPPFVFKLPNSVTTPSSLFLNRAYLLSTTDVNLTSHPASLTPALDKI